MDVGRRQELILQLAHLFREMGDVEANSDEQQIRLRAVTKHEWNDRGQKDEALEYHRFPFLFNEKGVLFLV